MFFSVNLSAVENEVELFIKREMWNIKAKTCVSPSRMCALDENNIRVMTSVSCEGTSAKSPLLEDFYKRVYSHMVSLQVM